MRSSKAICVMKACDTGNAFTSRSTDFSFNEKCKGDGGNFKLISPIENKSVSKDDQSLTRKFVNYSLWTLNFKYIFRSGI